MWICANCRIAHDFSLVTSYGPCEKCGKNAICMDIQVSNKKTKKTLKKPLKANEIRGLSRSDLALRNKNGNKKLKKR